MASLCSKSRQPPSSWTDRKERDRSHNLFLCVWKELGNISFNQRNSLQDNSLYSFSIPKTEIDPISSESFKTHTHTNQFCKGFLSPSKNDLWCQNHQLPNITRFPNWSDTLFKSWVPAMNPVLCQMPDAHWWVNRCGPCPWDSNYPDLHWSYFWNQDTLPELVLVSKT